MQCRDTRCCGCWPGTSVVRSQFVLLRVRLPTFNNRKPATTFRSTSVSSVCLEPIGTALQPNFPVYPSIIAALSVCCCLCGDCRPFCWACGSRRVESGWGWIDIRCHPGHASGIYAKWYWVVVFFGKDTCLAPSDGAIEVAESFACLRWCSRPCCVPSVL